MPTKHDLTLKVLDKNNNATDKQVLVHVTGYDDMLAVETCGVTVYIEKLGERVGVFVSADVEGRSDAQLSVLVDPTNKEEHLLRYDYRHVRCVSNKRS